jgi:hypothetical protein
MPHLLPGSTRRLFGGVWESAHSVPLPSRLATTIGRSLTGYYGYVSAALLVCCSNE